MSIPKLLLVTHDHRTFEMFQDQIKDFYKEKIMIVKEEDLNKGEDIDLILVSSSQLKYEKNYPSGQVIIARRAIDPGIVEKLVALPPNTECLVVNNIPDSTYDSIRFLENLGLNLRFYPYYPGIDSYKKTKVAIIPKATEIVPEGIQQIIDIHVRPLDLSTLIEIGSRLHINLDEAHLFSAKYIKEIIHLTRSLTGLLNDVNKLNHELDAILNTVHDGIIATDGERNIIKINKAANKILGVNITELDMIGKKIDHIFPKLVLQNTNEELTQSNKLISVNEKKLVVNKTSIIKDDQNIGDVTAFQDVTRIQHLEQDIRKQIQKKGFSSRYSTEDIIGNSKKIKETIRIMDKIGKTDRTVLILGENGTGKELFAHSIHNLSIRKNGPFIPVNFAGLPESLAESELFGYEEGTFTGGNRGGKQGLFEMAHNGTIFLDEIGDASLNLQILLLRVLQEQQVMRVGGRGIIPVNVRVIAATNKDLKRLVEEGKFREDLYYRLFVLPLRIPSLRERAEDIPVLIHTFLKDYSSSVPQIDDEVMKILLNYKWPGNIRELLSVIQYMTIVMEGKTITVNDLPEQFKQTKDANKVDRTDLISKLKLEGEIEEFYYILKCLYEAKQQRINIGRGKIVEFTQHYECHLSEQQVRRRMEILKNLELIHSGNKGQGSKITDYGISVLNLIKHSMFKVNSLN
ncbi:PAS domain S-box-containing protein [Bacillus mesophilus]|uniref:PAS domain S-box protein n=1 Tax=Bacillus mesophilus TaxID=1808955 RepID=A0A6M0Q816_9BACI|nr:sigma 54-interacting transcriptional regulator [Bacillus mesophilus]MBM7662142.1 PAS domain S-box-containing protein [Bacillus mesophilus]NEY72505.1 PAS domain S-box protein [Bacillus mesophilus]